MNSLFYYRLFKELDYDIISVSTYAAKYSAYNPIEHAWSPLSNMLAGVIFSPKMEGDSKTPCEQSKLSKIQLQEKEFSVFNKVISELKGYCKDAKFDSYPVAIDTVKCGEDELRWNDYDRVNNAVINWIGYESYDLCFHSMCAGLGHRSERELEQIDYKCEVCST